MQAAAPAIYQAAMGINGVTLPPDPVQQQPTYGDALSLFEQAAPIRVLFDSGGGRNPGEPYPEFEQSFSKFPIPGTSARRWYLSSGGSLADRLPAHGGANAFTWNAHARPLTDFSGNDTGSSPGDLWTASPNYHWLSPPFGSAVSYLSSPLRGDTTVIGAGAVRLWVRSSKPNVDLQVTVTEVRPDGKETFVQNGWVRASERKLDQRKSTLLEPVLSLRKSAVSPLPRHRFVSVTVPLYYEGHVYRAGSRIRILISAPNGDQPVWSFGQTSPKGRAAVAVAFSKRMPSSLILPIVPGVTATGGLPPCPGLRGEPCRAYQPIGDRRAKL
jgi:predicted acyl esterase